MSHLSSMRTCLSNLTLLEHSLTVLGINWYRENYSHVVIPQDNGHDFGFFWNGKEFEFIGDEKLIMWIDYKKVNNLTTAETWKNLLEAEGLPTKIIPENGLLEWSEKSNFRILVPKGREHVADEIIRKI